MGNLFRGKGLKAVEKAEANDPKAMLASEVDRFNTAQADFNVNLARQAGLVKRLEGQVAKGKSDTAVILNRIKALVKVPDGQAKAQQLALELQRIEKDTTENEKQAVQAKTMYESLTRQRDTFVREAQARIENIKSMIGRAEMAEAQATLAKMTTSAKFDPNAGDLSHIESQLQNRIAEAEGTVQVAQDAAAASPWALTEAEQQIQGESALADVVARFQADDAPKA
jgi:phage shock protein A